MRWLDNARRAKALYDSDMDAHIGDIAVLKTDLVGVDVRSDLQPLLDPVRGWVPEVDLDELAALPENTFGHELVRFMRDNGLSPFRITDEIDEAMRRRNAFGIRYATTHDMFHVLLGFDTTWVGELGVLGFAVGQNYTPWQKVAALFALVLYPLWSGFQLRALWRAWTRGLRAGRRAPFLLGVRLEDRFADDLESLRAELGLIESDHAQAHVPQPA